MDEDEVDRLRKEAEKFAEQDKEKRNLSKFAGGFHGVPK